MLRPGRGRRLGEWHGSCTSGMALAQMRGNGLVHGSGHRRGTRLSSEQIPAQEDNAAPARTGTRLPPGSTPWEKEAILCMPGIACSWSSLWGCLCG